MGLGHEAVAKNQGLRFGAFLATNFGDDVQVFVSLADICLAVGRDVPLVFRVECGPQPFRGRRSAR